jgi:hypothetical protein
MNSSRKFEVTPIDKLVHHVQMNIMQSLNNFEPWECAGFEKGFLTGRPTRCGPKQLNRATWLPGHAPVAAQPVTKR